MFKLFPGEKFKKLRLHRSLRLNYAISNFGRLVSYTNKIKEGNIVHGSMSEGYRVWRYKLRGGKKIKHKSLYLCKAVAAEFLKKPSPGYRLIHLDYDKGNDVITNLKWVPYATWSAHVQNSPEIKAMKRKMRSGEISGANTKLTRAKVIAIKQQIGNPNRKKTLKQIARDHNISEMQLYRIKSGENWGYLKV